MTPIEQIAQKHRERDPLTTHIYYSETSEELRMLEVSNDTSTIPAIIPFRFKPHDDYPLPISIAVISPEELKLLKEGELDLPEGWGKFEDLKQVRGL